MKVRATTKGAIFRLTTTSLGGVTARRINRCQKAREKAVMRLVAMSRKRVVWVKEVMSLVGVMLHHCRTMVISMMKRIALAMRSISMLREDDSQLQGFRFDPAGIAIIGFVL